MLIPVPFSLFPVPTISPMHTIRTTLVAIVSASALAAQNTKPDTVRVSPVVVTATRAPLSQGALPVAVTVITADDIRLHGITTVAEALGEVTSAYVAQSGSQGATTSLFLRGGESKYVKVLIDGVAANDPGGAFDFASLSTDNIERIEVVRGPASVIHGADAVTGVVHIITRRGSSPAHSEVDVRTGVARRDRMSASAKRGAMRTVDATGSIGGGLPSGTYSVSIARHQSNGLYAQNNRFQNNVLSGRFQVTPAQGTELRVALRYNDYQFNYPTDGGGNVVDANAYRIEDRTIIGVELERRLMATLRGVLALNSSVNEGGTDDAMDSPTGSSFISQDKTRRRGAELRFHLLPVNITAVTLGAQIEQQDQRSQFQSQSSFGPFTSQFRAARRNVGVYGEAVVTPSDRFTATVGGRVDDNEQFGNFTTMRAGFSWRPLSATRIRATTGTAYREPSFFENYSTGFVAGNPQLEPERTISWDAGIEQDIVGGRAQVALTGFAQNFRNMIDYTGSAASCGYSYCNVAAARSNGIELELRGRLYGEVWASAGATALRTKVLDPGFDQTSGGLYKRGEALIRRPERRYNAEVSYRGRGRLTGAVRAMVVGTRTDRDFRTFPATPVTLDGYRRVDASAAYDLGGKAGTRAAATLRIENVLNEGYQSVFNFVTPRRTISLGARISS